MPNYCGYEMKIKGSMGDIERVVACLKEEYSYSDGRKPDHKHFFRVFSAYDDIEAEDNGDGTFTKTIYGDCAWSVHSCMQDGVGTYYGDCAEKYGSRFMGTTLAEQSIGCEIEVFGEESGINFSEHYIYEDGECILDEEVDTELAGYDESGEVTTDIDWDSYDGDIITLNPNRKDMTEGYLWQRL